MRKVAARGSRRVIGFGDSLTAEAGGWFDLLSSVDLPRDFHCSFVNAGVSGDTTVHALARVDHDVIAHRPAVVFVLFGTNDSRTYQGWPLDQRLVSLAEYRRNVSLLGQRIKAGVPAVRLLLMTPPPCDDRLTQSYPFGTAETYDSVELARRAAIVRDVAVEADLEVVDIARAFGSTDVTEMLADGLHPSAAGHQLIAALAWHALAPSPPNRRWFSEFQ